MKLAWISFVLSLKCFAGHLFFFLNLCCLSHIVFFVQDLHLMQQARLFIGIKDIGIRRNQGLCLMDCKVSDVEAKFLVFMSNINI